MSTTTTMTVGESITVVTNLAAPVVFEVVAVSAKAVQLRNVGGSPDASGRTIWLPLSALSFNADFSYGAFQAFTLSRWMLSKLNRAQKFALELLC